MEKLFSLLLIVVAIALISKTPVMFYTKPKETRLLTVWKKDIDSLMEKKDFQKYFKNLSTVSIHFTDPDVAEEFDKMKSPFTTAGNKGSYILRVTITRWIKGNRYGFIVEHEVFSKYKDKLDEFGKTYTIGFIW